MNAQDVTTVLGELFCPASSNNSLQVHFNKGEVQGYVDAYEDNGPWEVVLLGRTRVVGYALTTPDELKQVMDTL
jgi:hypothetical protein